MDYENFIDALLLETMFTQWLDAMMPESNLKGSLMYRSWARRKFVVRLSQLMTRPQGVVHV
jgi:hypothetical protein